MPPSGVEPPAHQGSASPSSEERVLAAASHLLLFMGVWVIGPLVIYFWQKDRSRFVAFHAVQATLTALAMIAVSMLGLVGYLVFVVAGVALGAAGAPVAAGIVMVAAVVAVMLLALLPSLLALWAAWRAYHGERYAIPIIGRVAGRLIEEHSATPSTRAAGAQGSTGDRP